MRNEAKLCEKAKTVKMEYLYRQSARPQGECPAEYLASGWDTSLNMTYAEYLSEEGAYVQDCGQPRSEMNKCVRRHFEDPQFTFNFGGCPSTSLIHRQSLTQNFQCVGSWVEPR